MPSFNDHLIENTVGKTISFDVQPYEGGTGEIVKMTPRMVKHTDRCPRRGKMIVEYEVYDLEIRVATGRKVGALWGGVAVPGTIHDTAGQIARVDGVTSGQIYEATAKGRPIIQARCG